MTAAEEVVRKFEGCELDAYLCPARVPTIGWGHTSGVHLGMTITQELADAWLAADLARAAKGVLALVTRPLTVEQQAALTSLAYNVGTGALTRSRLIEMVNARRDVDAMVEFARWDKANGKALPGLTARRLAEAQLYGLGCKGGTQSDS